MPAIKDIQDIDQVKRDKRREAWRKQILAWLMSNPQDSHVKGLEDVCRRKLEWYQDMEGALKEYREGLKKTQGDK